MVELKKLREVQKAKAALDFTVAQFRTFERNPDLSLELRSRTGGGLVARMPEVTFPVRTKVREALLQNVYEEAFKLRELGVYISDEEWRSFKEV